MPPPHPPPIPPLPGPLPPGQNPGFANFNDLIRQGRKLCTRRVNLNKSLQENIQKERLLQDEWEPLIQIANEVQNAIHEVNSAHETHEKMEEKYYADRAKVLSHDKQIAKILVYEKDPTIFQNLCEEALAIITKHHGSLDSIRAISPQITQILFNHEYNTLSAKYIKYKNDVDLELGAAKKDLAKSQDLNKRLQSYKGDVENRLQSANARIDAECKTNQELRSSILIFEKYKNQFGPDLQQAQEDFLKLKDSATELQKYKDQFGPDLQQAQEDFLKLKDSATELQKYKDQFGTDFQQAKENYGQLKESDTNLQKSQEEVIPKLKELGEKLDELQKYKGEAEPKINQAKQDIDDLNKYKAEAEPKLKQAQLDSVNLKAALDEAHNLRGQNEILQAAEEHLSRRTKLLEERFLRKLFSHASKRLRAYHDEVHDELILILSGNNEEAEANRHLNFDNLTNLELIGILNGRVQAHEATILERDNEIMRLDSVVDSHVGSLSIRDNYISRLDEQLENLEHDFNNVYCLVGTRNHEIRQLNGQISDFHQAEEEHRAELNEIWQSAEVQNQLIQELFIQLRDHEKDIHDLTEVKDREIGLLHQEFQRQIDEAHAAEDSITRDHQMMIQEYEKDLHDLTVNKDREIQRLYNQLQGQLEDAHASEYAIVQEHQNELNYIFESSEANFQYLAENFSNNLGTKDTEINRLKDTLNHLNESLEQNQESLCQSNKRIKELDDNIKSLQDTSKEEKVSLQRSEENLANTNLAFCQTLSSIWFSNPKIHNTSTWNDVVSIMTQNITINPVILEGPALPSRWQVNIRSNFSSILPGWYINMTMSNRNAASLLYVILKENRCMEYHWLCLFLINRLSESIPTSTDSIVPIIISHYLEIFDDLFSKDTLIYSMKFASIALGLVELWKIVTDRFTLPQWTITQFPNSVLRFNNQIIPDLYKLMQVDMNLTDEALDAIFPSSNTRFLNLNRGVAFYAISDSSWFVLIWKKEKVIVFFDKVLLKRDVDRAKFTRDGKSQDLPVYRIQGPKEFKDFTFVADSPVKRKWFHQYVDVNHQDKLSLKAMDVIAKLNKGEFVW